MGAILGPVAGAVVGGLFQQDAADTAASAQQASDAARLAEEKRVREKLDADIAAQKLLANQAFDQYQQGLLSQAQAQQGAQTGLANLQQQIAQGQLGDLSKVMGMAQFKPFGIKTGAGASYFDPTTGGAGYAMSPELAGTQQSLFQKAQQAAAGVSTDPTQYAADYMAKQQALLAPQRAAEDAQLRAQQLQRGTLGLGVASEAAGAGTGGMVNQQQFQTDRARAIADAQMAANAMNLGQQFNANQANLVSGLLSSGLSPEQQAIQSLQLSGNLGSMAQQAGQNMANLYSGGMSDYYKSLLGAGQTQAASDVLGANALQTGLNEAYQRQQGLLSGLVGNPLQYQAMTTPQATIPGSAYMNAALGSGLMNAGMAGINKYFNTPYSTTNPVSNYSPFSQQYASASTDPIATMNSMFNWTGQQ